MPSPTSPAAAPNAAARAEREALCDLLLDVGPDAATLCGGWTTRDLAAHLVMRENRPDAALGIPLRMLSGWTAKVQGEVATRDYNDVVDDIRQGPPRWSPTSIPAVDGDVNTIEFFVHHEDVRRALPVWTPRPLDDATARALWSRLSRGARILLRRSPVGVVALPSDGPEAGRSVVLKGGTGAVTLRGPVGEIVLAVYGRVTSGLELEGAARDVESFRSFAR